MYLLCAIVLIYWLLHDLLRTKEQRIIYFFIENEATTYKYYEVSNLRVKPLELSPSS
jgi:hypothetical protein